MSDINDNPTNETTGTQVPPAATPSPAPAKLDYADHGVPRRGTGRGVKALGVIVLVAGAFTGGILMRDRALSLFSAHEHEGESKSGDAKQLYTCGMHPQVIQDKPGNCPICGMALEPMKADLTAANPGGGAGAKQQPRTVKYYWDPMMNPPYISAKPGKSPMGMDLIPVYEDEVSGGTAVQIDPVVVQNMGVRVAPLVKGPVKRTLRAVGYVEWAQPNIHDVNLRISGWVEKLHANTEGMHVEKGQPLFDLYSPEIQVAVEELIAARRSRDAQGDEGAGPGANVSATLYQASHRKLMQWGLDEAQIDRLSKLDAAPRTVTYVSPVSGDLIEKTLVEGASAMMGQRALRIVDRSTLWLDAQVYAIDLPFIKLGQPATATIEGLPEREFAGEVVFVDPRVDASTRTAKVRVALPNPKLDVRPGMFGTVLVTARLVEEATLVPREAVIETGTRRVVFVATGEGHFEPRNVKIGSPSDDGMVQLLSGLAPDDQVVVSGQFLLDSESRMKEAIQKHLRDKLLREKGGPGPGTVATKGDGGGHQGHSAAGPGAGTAQPAAGHDVHAPAATTRPVDGGGGGIIHGSPAWHASVDAVAREYLKLSSTFGVVQQDDRPADVSGLTTAAGELKRSAVDPAQRRLADGVLAAAEPLVGQGIDVQRKGFRAVSGAVLALADASPPSDAVAGPGGKLSVFYCSMADGHWLQMTEQKANPYYAKSMKTCAELKRTIAPAHAGRGH